MTFYSGPEGASSTTNAAPGNSTSGFWNKTKGFRDTAKAYAVNPGRFVPDSLSQVMGKSRFAGTAGRAFAEALGVDYGGAPVGNGTYGTNQGFMGARNWVGHKLTENKFAKFMGVTGSVAGLATTYNYVSDGYAQGGITGAGMGLAESAFDGYVSRHIAGVILTGAGAVGSAARSGYAIGSLGSVGARGVASGLGLGGAMGALSIVRGLLHPASLAVMGGAFAIDAAGEYIQETDQAIARNKQVRGLELGGPIQDQFGTISTLRQRSLNALQNTHVNGRMAFGQEAALLHSTF
jgi:hypothetical protein